MRTFRYEAVDPNGNRLKGEIEAQDRKAVLARLNELELMAVEIAERSVSSSSSRTSRRFFSSGPTHKQITLFTHELAMLLKAGMPLAEALSLLGRDNSSKKLSSLIGKLGDEIDSGRGLADAMAAQDGLFPPIYTNMVRVAESSGTLESVLQQIAINRQRAEKLRSKAISAAIYPLFLVFTAIAAILIMLTVVVPRFKQMIAQAGSDAPASAQFVIGLSDWLIAHHMTLIFALCGFLLALIYLWNHRGTREFIESIMLSVPLVGSLLKMNMTIRFCRTLGTLLENGVDLPSSLRLSRDVIGQKKAEAALDASYEDLRKGKGFIAPLAASGLFPATVINMLRVGEESSGLVGALHHLSDLYEDKLETDLQRLFTILEPVIILCVSGFIAAIIVSVLSAVLSINDLAL